MANVTRYDPFGELVEDMLKGFFVRPVLGADPGTTVGAARPRIEVTEHGSAYKVLADIPGVKKDEIQVTIDGDQVTISAEVRRERDAKEGERVLHSERHYGKVARAFRLGQEIDQSQASAKYNDGVLELTLPKKQTASARQLSIQ